MSYQVLARKYRPRSFSQFVGQETTCRVLKNALESQRIHHAYLFSGTRGVGKTSLGRLLSKCLNCQEKISSTPCDQCGSCCAIDTGRAIDLIEIDAASRTRIEEMRELLADVHYLPHQGRYKIYLIDEAHMLSAHSFNALLKTLEEPPPHVVFLLATTDPQRLPATVLSRCLQFHLKALSIEQISAHLANILNHEHVIYDAEALPYLSQAARGSLRDALSLLDQAILYSQGRFTEQAIKSLLGNTNTVEIRALLTALAANDPVQLWSVVEALDAQAVDFVQAIDELLVLLHRIAQHQVLPATVSPELGQEQEDIKKLAQQFQPEDTQLYYQIVLLSRNDLALAPYPRLGFEMMLLRMLAFRPAPAIGRGHIEAAAAGTEISSRERELTLSEAGAVKDKLPVGSQRSGHHPPAPPRAQSDERTTPCPDVVAKHTMLDWPEVVERLNLTGPARALAHQCVLHDYTANQVTLLLDPRQAALRTATQEEKLALALARYLGRPVNLCVRLGDHSLPTPARHEQQEKSKRLEQTTEILKADPTVQAMIRTFDATLQPESIRFLDE